MSTLPPPERVFWHVEDKFYSEAADGTVGEWTMTGTVERIPVDHRIRLVRLCRLGEQAPEQIKARHAREVEIARDMAAARERAIVGGAVRDAELRVSLAERDARDALESKTRKVLDTQRGLDGERADWAAAMTHLIAMADRIGAIWGEEEIGTWAASAWRDPETGEHYRHLTSVAIERVLERLDEVLADEHPSVAYPVPTDVVVELAEANLRAAIGAGRDLTGAVRDMLAGAAERERPTC